MGIRFSAIVVHTKPEALGELVDLLSSPEVKVTTARSAKEAIHKIAAERHAIIIVGHAPPVLDAVALLEETVRYAPDAVRILMTSSPEDAIEVDHKPNIDAPIIRFVGRPSERSQLIGLVAQAVKLLRLVRAQRELVANLAREYERLQRREKLLDVVVGERTKELEVSYLKLKAANRQALFGLAEAIEAKDPYTKGHCGRVAAYALLLAQEVGYPEEHLEALEFGAFLHDIGKIGVRDAVLLKPGPLTEEEWAHVRSHPEKGYEIATKIDMLKPVIGAVRNHHERWDGKGYPDKLEGTDIPLEGRIVAIADAFDAMATDRPYKEAMSMAQSELRLRRNAGVMYDPELVEVFCARHVGAALHAVRICDDADDVDEEDVIRPVQTAEPAPVD